MPDGRSPGAAGLPAAGQDDAPATKPAEKKVLGVDDYGRFSRVDSVRLSDDGRWVSHRVRPNDGDGTLLVRRLGGDEEKVHEFERGSQPSFSDDGAWLSLIVEPPEKKGKAKKGDDKEIQKLRNDIDEDKLKLKEEFGYTKQEINKDPDLMDMQKRYKEMGGK